MLLSFSNLTFSQSGNPYVNFSAESLKNHKDYTKNYNPIDCDFVILKQCLLDMINEARAEFTFAMPLTGNVKLDSIAKMQADYQASKETRTIDNMPPYKYTSHRLNLVGFSYRGSELASKAKTSRGIEEYSYYDLCLSFLQQILKNVKQAEILLDKKYSVVGIGVGVDRYMKDAYLSIVLGNDRTFNYGVPKITERNPPFTKKKMGLKPSDDKICKKCNSDNQLEVLSDYIQVSGDDVYFICDNIKQLRRLIGKDEDAIVLDFVQNEQYKCDKANVMDNNRENRGFMTPPLTYEMLLINNEITEKKSTKLKSLIAYVPDEIESNDFQINILVLKGKNVCRTILKKNIECKNATYQEKIYFLKDTTSIPIKGAFVPTAEKDNIEFVIPFTPEKTTYSYEDIAPYIQDLNKPHFTIESIDIIAHNSLNYSKDQKQIQLQKKRAESIMSAFQRRYGEKEIEFNIEYDDSWEEFKRDVVYSEDYYDLTLFSKEEAYTRLTERKGFIANALEDDYLKKHRFAKIILHVTYSADGKHEQDYVIHKFNSVIAEGNATFAMAIQRYIMSQVEEKKYGSKVVNSITIPLKKEYQALLNNQFYIKYLVENKLSDEMCTEMEKIYNLNQLAPIVAFNQNICKLNNATFNSINDINVNQVDIDKLYTYMILPQERVNSLNLELQFKIVEYLKKLEPSTEVTTLLNSTYTKIKAIRNPKLDSWQNAYKLASVFINNGDYDYALSLMDPFITAPNLSDDFIFSYVSVGGYKEDTFLSPNYAYVFDIAAQRDRNRLCNLVEKMSICIADNSKVKKIICEQCK